MAETVIERMDPLAPVDYVLEDIMGIPGIGSVLKTLAPAEVASTLGLPTPAEISKATLEKLKSKVEEKVVR